MTGTDEARRLLQNAQTFYAVHWLASPDIEAWLALSQTPGQSTQETAG